MERGFIMLTYSSFVVVMLPHIVNEGEGFLDNTCGDIAS